MKHSKLIIFIVLAIFGALITRQFGESWDELKFYKYADLALSTYKTWPTNGTITTFGDTYDNYGPAFVMLVSLLAKPLQLIFITSDARHYLYFLTFLAGIWAFYELSKRWLSQNTAIFSTLLFATQPVIFGHAFISPKDIPFLSFFLLSLHFGLKLFDSLEPIQTDQLDQHSSKTFLVLSTLWLVMVFGLFLFTDIIHTLLINLVQSAKAGQINIITYLASDLSKAKPEVYIQRYFLFFLWVRACIFLLSSVWLFFFINRRVPSFSRLFLSVLFPAILLGLTTSIRVLGPFVVVFIAYHAFRKLGKSAYLPLSLYAIIAVLTTYATWPYLWPNPLGHFIESVLVMSQYPWGGQVLFNGTYYASTRLPYSYLPVLFGIQFTEPVWALTLLGLIVAIMRLKEKRELVALFAIWFLLPLFGFIFTHSPLYDNFRQIFFIVPPVFMLAGIIFETIKDVRWQVGLMILCLLPGVMDGIRLHPYEYIYYNRFAGGVNGVFRKFDLDYWGTSYREAASYINEVAPEHATVWVDGPTHIFELYTRKDIKIYSDYEAARADHYDYVISTSRYNLDLTSFPDAKIIHAIERDNAILTTIKQP